MINEPDDLESSRIVILTIQELSFWKSEIITIRFQFDFIPQVYFTNPKHDVIVASKRKRASARKGKDNAGSLYFISAL